MPSLAAARAGADDAPDVAGPCATPVAGGREKPRMLFLCQNLPWPPDSGVLLRTYHVLRLLSREFRVRALCFYRAADRPTAEQVRASVAALRELAEVEAFEIPQEHSRARFVLDHLRSVAARRAYTVFAYESAAFRRRLREGLAAEPFDLVHVDSLDLAGYLPGLDALPVVCVHHNVESALLRRRAASQRNRLVRAYLRHQAKLVEREERAWCGRVALNVAVSHPDAAELARLAPGSRWAVVPNGVDTAAFHPAPGVGEILFVGGSTWPPNTDAMTWFCQAVLPLLRARGVAAPVRWVGRAPDALRERFHRKYGVDTTGYVDDVRPWLERARCVVVPLRSGGGTRLKILDAWGAGKAVVSTAVGCEGLDARDGENILVRDTPRAFADAVADVLRDDALCRRLASAARRTACEVYDWEVVGAEMLGHYRALLAPRAPVDAP